jgi:GxxExxY protein
MCLLHVGPDMPTSTGHTLAHRDLTGLILKCFFDVYGELGHGFSELVLRRAMAIALEEAGLRVREEAALAVHFRGRCIGSFRADMIVEDTVLVEVKAATALENYAVSQILNYLKVAGGGVGLLLNFGRKPEFKRYVVGDPNVSLPRLDRDPPSPDGKCS